MNKKGLTIRTIILLVLSMIGLAFVILIYSQAGLPNDISKQTCHQSIIYRATFNAGPFEPGRNTIPLKCYTENICLENSKESCESIYGKSSDKNPVTKIEVKNEGDVKEAISNALVDCHSIVGEGKVNFLPDSSWSRNYCIICSRFVLDKMSDSNFNSLSYTDLYKYMENKKKSDGQSYLEYVYGEKAQNLSYLLDKVVQDSQSKSLPEISKVEDYKINLNSKEGNVVVVSIGKKGAWAREWAAISGGLLVTTGIVLSPFTGGLSGVAVAVLAGGGTSTIIYSKLSPNDNSDFEYHPPAIVQYNPIALKQIGCTSFETDP